MIILGNLLNVMLWIGIASVPTIGALWLIAKVKGWAEK